MEPRGSQTQIIKRSNRTRQSKTMGNSSAQPPGPMVPSPGLGLCCAHAAFPSPSPPALECPSRVAPSGRSTRSIRSTPSASRQCSRTVWRSPSPTHSLSTGSRPCSFRATSRRHWCRYPAGVQGAGGCASVGGTVVGGWIAAAGRGERDGEANSGQPENCSAGGGGGDMDARRRREGGGGWRNGVPCRALCFV